MKYFQDKSNMIVAALVLLMMLTRFNHFGSPFVLPDASYAIFFLGGLFLGRLRGAMILLTLLLVEAALVDCYAISYRGISGWCVTSAYGFLIFAYSSLWFVGSWYAPRYHLTIKGLSGLLAIAVAAGSLAFIIANVSFYLLAGYFGHMSFVEYSSRVSQYFGSYVAVEMMYIGCAIFIQIVFAMLKNKLHDARIV